ncbi:transglycosylase SLT domain-containing protein [Streptomyces sp. NPDC003395]
MAISVGSVEVDVIPSTQGIYSRLRDGLVPAATRAGRDAGDAAGRAFGPAMQGAVGDAIGARIGQQIGQQIAARITATVRDALRDGVTQGGRTARPAATRQGDEAGGAFSRALKARLEAAFRSLPKADVRIGDTGFDADMARLRARLETLSGKRIGIDVDAGVALAEIADVEARLRRLGAEHPNVQVRADTAAALAQLAALRAEVDAVDGKSIDINTQSAVGGFSALTTAALAFGPAILPALPVVAAGLGAVAAAAVAAGAGIGGIALVALPAFKQIAGVLQAQKQAQEAATTASLKGGQAASQSASRALQMASAQQALATAERNGARQITQAQQQVTQAKQAAAQAVQQAAQQNEQAARRVQTAERALADAQVAAKKAQDDLVAARAKAAQELEDLNNRLTDSRLSQRDAEIQLKEATAQRDAVLKNTNSSELDKQKALLAYDQAVQRLKEQTLETQRLKAETDAANKAGVKGSQTYKSAQDRLVQAQRNVADQQQAVRDAQAEAARVQVQTAQQVAQAQQRVSEATANVAVAQQNAADSVASAQRQIQQASLSAAGGLDQAAIAQGKYEKALAGLTPAARGTYNAFLSLRTAFSAWSRSLQPAVMPLFTRALVGVRNVLPTLTPFVLAAAHAIKGLQDRMSAQLKTPFWQGFKQDLQTSIGPAITGLGVAFGNLIKGMAGLVDAFLPHMDSISARLQTITQRFANWGKGLKGSPEFERFLSYSAQQAPILAHMFGQLFGALVRLGVALNPMAGTATLFITAITGAINAVPVGVLTTVGVAFASVAIGSRLAAVALGIWKLAAQLAGIVTNILTGEQWALNTAMEANPIGFVVTAIMALIVAAIYAYQHIGWFRTAVQAAWAGIKTASLFLWHQVLQPVFSGIWTALKAVGTAALYLWNNAIAPAFRFIWEAAKILFTVLMVVVLLPIMLGFKAVAAVAMWLWRNAIAPAFNGIAFVAKWLYSNVIRPYFGFIAAEFRLAAKIAMWLWRNALAPAFNGIAAVAMWLWRNAIRPVFGFIADRASWLWNKGLKPPFDLLKAGVRAVGDAFAIAKDYIGKQWSKVADLAKKPIKFVVDTVYNSAIVPLWNKVADIVDAKKLSPLNVKGWATGGVLPGYTPGRDVHRFYSPTGGLLDLSGGEAVMRPEFTRAVGPGTVNALNAAARSGGVAGVRSALGLKGGGVIDWLSGSAKAIGHGIRTGIDWAKTGADLLAHPGKIWDKLTGGIKSLLGRIGNSKFAQLIARIPAGWLKSLKDKLVGLLAGGGGGGGDIGGSIPKGQRLAIINQALAAAGVPPPGTLPQWQAGLNTLITRESGWNPRAINRWDSNAKAGHPSQGLAQTIPGTFNHYVPASLRSRGILDPVANVAAAIRYIVSRYGNITRVQQANANRPPAGYDSGGYLQPGLNLAYNGTGRPEPVFTTAQANALTTLAGRGLAQQDPIVVELHAKEGTLGDFIDVRVQQHQRALVQVINAS